MPEEHLSPRNFFEIMLDAVYGACVDAMGEKYARRVLPLVATVTIYVFFYNIMGLVPGMAPPTDNLNAALQQRLGQCRAVDGDEGTLGAASETVQRPGDTFLSRTALTLDRNRKLGRGHPAKPVPHPQVTV